MDTINFWNELTESSPAIVLLLLGTFAVFARGSYMVVTELLKRLDRKDAEISRLQSEMLIAVNEMRKAIDNLSDALRDASHRR